MKKGDLFNSIGVFREILGYDAHGNITSVTRKGKKSSSTYGTMDNLTLSYDGNRLAGVSETVADYDFAGSFEYKKANGSQYAYDDNGSLVADKSRGITYVAYDVNNNPQQIYIDNAGDTKYVYDASGRKLRVIHLTAVPNIMRKFGRKPADLTPSQILYADTTDYLLGGSLVMRNGRVDKVLFEGGYAQATGVGIIADTFAFNYYNQDHLGNNREVVDSAGTVIQVTSYYPFGTPYADPAAVMDADYQPYKYNGKELDRMHGLDTYDYGARQYDPILGRWDRVDPLCEKYYSVSPYAYCHNNPVMYVDPNGKDDYRFDSKTGTFYLMDITTDERDRVYGYHYDKKSGQYHKNEDFISSKVQISNIEKGILEDGLNLKDKNLLISVGGENEPSVQGVKEFTLALSELVNREISGLGYSVDGTGGISDIEIGKYNKNTYTSSFCIPFALAEKYKESFATKNIVLKFHTHPDGNLGATQSAPNLSKDIRKMREEKKIMPNATFLVLYNYKSNMEEYNYTEK